MIKIFILVNVRKLKFALDVRTSSTSDMDQKTSTSVGAATNVSYPAHAARHSVFHVEGS